MISPRTLLAAALLLCLAAPAPAVAGPSVDPPLVETGWAVRHDTSPPLREIAVRRPQAPGFEREVPIGERPPRPRPEIEQTADPARQTGFRPDPGAALTPPPMLSVPGLAETDNEAVVGFGVVPPDTEGDVGADLYMQWINLVWALYDKGTGALVAGPFAGNSFWQGFGGDCQSTNDGDPIVLYDDNAGRWLVSQFAIDSGTQCVAVSATGDPLGSYHRYAFVITPGGANDYPKLGVWDDGTGGSSAQSAYTFTSRDFIGFSTFNLGSGVFERDAMLAGQPAQFVKFVHPCTGADCVEGLLPPHLDGAAVPAGTCPTYFAAYDAQFDDGPAASDGYRNYTLCVDWADPGGGSTFVENALVAGTPFNRAVGNGFSACVPTPGESVDCLAIFTMYRAQVRWLGDRASVVLNHTVDANGADLNGIRWAELESASGAAPWSLAQDGTYSPDSSHRWMGSIAQDRDGNMALGYSVASSSLFPGVRYTSRTPADAPGTMPGGEVTCHAGTGAQVSSFGRWGDYSTMSVDPVDDCTFWFTTEYYETTGSFDFHSRLCKFRFDGCGGGGCVPDEPDTELTCDDGADNDCDGLVDCDDSDCAADPACDVGGGVPCEDVRGLRGRCSNRGRMGVRVVLSTMDHDGETVTIDIDGTPHVLTVEGRRAAFTGTGFQPGDHTVTLIDPADCPGIDPLTVTCP